MKATIIGLFLIAISAQLSWAQSSITEQEIINLSKEKWQWMSDKKVDTLKVSTLLPKTTTFSMRSKSN